MLRSLRTRLAVLFAGTLVLATVIAGAASIRLYQSYNRDQVKMELRSQVGSIAEYYGQAMDRAYGSGQAGNPEDSASRRAAADGRPRSRSPGSPARASTDVGDPGGALFPNAPLDIENAGVKPPFNYHSLKADARPSFEFKPKGDPKHRTFVGVAAPVMLRRCSGRRSRPGQAAGGHQQRLEERGRPGGRRHGAGRVRRVPAGRVLLAADHPSAAPDRRGRRPRRPGRPRGQRGRPEHRRRRAGPAGQAVPGHGRPPARG